MKRIVKAAVLMCVAAALPTVMFAQGAPGQGAGAGAGAGAAAPAAGGGTGQCQMPDAEYQVYNNALTQAQPAGKAAALEAYLTQFPNSCAKLGALQTLSQTYLQAGDVQHAISAADRMLQLDPNNFAALGYEAYLHNAAAATAANGITDPDKVAAAEIPELDKAAQYAQKGLAVAKPASMSDADFTTAKETAYPIFYSVMGNDALQKKDYPTAIDSFKKELAFVQGDPKLTAQLTAPGQVLQDTFYLGVAYLQSQPPDYLDCAFYMTRFVAVAPEPYKTQKTPNAKYCYHQYHGHTDDQFDKLTQIAQANVNPPADLGTTITPAPTPAETIAGILKTTTPDQLATSDKEYILQNGSADQVQTVWDSMKGKSFQFPNVLVIASTPQQVQVAISDDAVQNKTADFTFNMTPPEELPARATPLQKKKYQAEQDAIAAAIAPGKTVTLSGTFDSYTPKPFMITMSDGAVILPEAAKPTKPSPAHAPVHHTPPHRAQ